MLFMSPAYVNASTNIPNPPTNTTSTQNSSNPLFAKCGTTLVGNSTLPGMNATQSLNEVLYDNSTDSYVIGNAVFDIAFSSENTTLVNGPGHDLLVTELGGPELLC